MILGGQKRNVKNENAAASVSERKVGKGLQEVGFRIGRLRMEHSRGQDWGGEASGWEKQRNGDGDSGSRLLVTAVRG